MLIFPIVWKKQLLKTKEDRCRRGVFFLFFKRSVLLSPWIAIRSEVVFPSFSWDLEPACILSEVCSAFFLSVDFFNRKLKNVKLPSTLNWFFKKCNVYIVVYCKKLSFTFPTPRDHHYSYLCAPSSRSFSMHIYVHICILCFLPKQDHTRHTIIHCFIFFIISTFHVQ